MSRENGYHRFQVGPHLIEVENPQPGDYVVLGPDNQLGELALEMMLVVQNSKQITLVGANRAFNGLRAPSHAKPGYLVKKT